MIIPILTLLCTLALIILTTINIKHKTYEYLFICIYALLPDYYSIELTPALPLISASRILLLILLLYSFFQNNFFKDSIYNFKKHLYNDKLNFLLVGYILLRLTSNLYYITTYGTALKTIFSLFFEELILTLLVASLFTNSLKIEKAIKLIVSISNYLFILAIFESISGINIGSVLYIARRQLVDEYFIRLGLLRADLFFGLPSFFATYCVMVLPLILYMYEQKYEKKYLLSILLNVFALIHSGCRAQLIFLIALTALMWLFKTKALKLHYIKVYSGLILVFTAIIIVLCISSSHLKYYYIGTGKAILNEVGFNLPLNDELPEGVEGFGTNSDGTYSRTAQFSGIKYTLSKNPLFGLGSGAQNRNEIMYYWKGNWKYSNKYDIGYVAIIADEGLIGMVAYILLSAYTLITLLRYKDKMNKTFSFVFIGYLICLLTNDLSDSTFWIFFSLFYAYNRHRTVFFI